MLFDSHTHLNNERYSEQEVLQLMEEIENSQVSYVMDVGFDLASSDLAVKHAQAKPWCYAAVGFHPHDAKNLDNMTLELIRGLAKKEKVKAIGFLNDTGAFLIMTFLSGMCSGTGSDGRFSLPTN